jgi:SAM-dependent methyltransferase
MSKLTMDEIREDFDRIALLSEHHGDAGGVHHNYIWRHLPSRCENALEIGCGTGEFTRFLAGRAQHVTAVDLSPEMIRLAQQQSVAYSNIEYVMADALRLTLPAESYDCVVSLATLHHLPLEQALLKMKDALKPGGVLIIQDLVRDERIVDLATSAFAYPFSLLRRFWKTGRLRTPPEVRKAWSEHGARETYLTLREVKEMCRVFLPEAKVRRNLFWRYTVVWHKRKAT